MSKYRPFFLSVQVIVAYPLGRPKGSRDKKKRKKSGYILREARKRQQQDSEQGINKSIEAYLN